MVFYITRGEKDNMVQLRTYHHGLELPILHHETQHSMGLLKHMDMALEKRFTSVQGMWIQI